MSLAWFMVMTSAARPATTLPACLLEPPCDWLSVRVSPVVCFQCLQADVYDRRSNAVGARRHELIADSIEPEVTQIYRALGLRIAD